MIEYLTDISWLIPYRADAFTAFFKLMPYFAWPTFYLMFIPLGYWLINQNKFRDLLFLIVFTGILNPVLKAICLIPRPDVSLHLISVGNNLGFPSGDSQLALVFWGFLYLSYKQAFVRYLSLAMILLMGISRVYLGVHTPLDILMGYLVGALTLYFYLRLNSLNLVTRYLESKKGLVFSLIIVSSMLAFLQNKQFLSSGSLLSGGLWIGASLGYLFPQKLSFSSIKDQFYFTLYAIITLFAIYYSMKIMLAYSPYSIFSIGFALGMYICFLSYRSYSYFFKKHDHAAKSVKA